MRKKLSMLVFLAAVVALSCVRMATAEDAATKPPSETGTVEDAIQASKNPVPWLSWGADVRLREIFTPNLLLDKEDRHFQRYRFRAWNKVTPIEDLDLNVRLVYEPRHFCQPWREAQTRDAYYIDEWTGNEAIFDQMNVKWSKALGLPLTVTVGRQDIILGNGWLVLDGTPLDGSRTIFFDAARATIDFMDANTKVDLIFIDQHADSDWWIKPFCDKDFHNIEQDEKGAILYVTNTSLPKTEINAYFMYKHDEAVIGKEPGDISAGNVAPWQAGTDADIYAFGARAAGALGENWKYRAEFAQEFGNKNATTVCAFGANTLLQYDLNDAWKNNLHMGYEFLSGDDPDTETNEQFDPLWARWPQFSELLAYTVALENRPGETTNLHRIGFGWACQPSGKCGLAADYHLLFADEKDSYPGRPYFNGDDCFRGQLLTGQLTYKFNPHISGHVRAELFCPGNFYSDLYNETAGFFRYELVFSW